MKEKDLAEKQLMAYEDVYADILNILLFRGKKRGEKRGRYNVLKELVEEGILTVEEAAKRINMSQDKFSKMMD